MEAVPAGDGFTHISHTLWNRHLNNLGIWNLYSLMVEIMKSRDSLLAEKVELDDKFLPARCRPSVRCCACTPSLQNISIKFELINICWNVPLTSKRALDPSMASLVHIVHLHMVITLNVTIQSHNKWKDSGPWFIIIHTSIGNPIMEIKRSYDLRISTMRFPIQVRQHLYIESGPRSFKVFINF